MTHPQRTLYYGWLILASISGINFANAVTSIGVLTVFVLPITTEFGWTMTQISAATSLGAVLGALMAPFSGRLADKVGARVILTAAGAIIVVSTLSIATMQTLLGFYTAFGLARLADQGLVQSVSAPAVAKWFLRYRGRALAILFFVTSVGGMALPMLAQFIIEVWNWRLAWAALSAVMLLIGLIPVALVVRRQPEDIGLRPDDSEANNPQAPSSIAPLGKDLSDTIQTKEPEVSLAPALRTPTLWFLLGSGFLVGVGSTGIGLHLMPFLVQQGLDSTTAVTTVSIGFLAAGISNLWWGLLCERFSARLLLTTTYLIRAVTVMLVLSIDSPVEAYMFAIIRGCTEGGIATIAAILLAEYYGRRHLGSIYGLNRAVQVMGFALGPLISGAVYDISHSYRPAFLSFFFLTLTASVLVVITKRPCDQSPKS